ncbi:MAG TPA: penicillin-binding protein activator LpoB, partial [Verrucomicrobiota bacterium]|nr:penicillin-binding protein activator LpoB [Verrucomicrobiota bacterium]
ALDKVPTPPAVMVVSRVVNSTTQQLDTDLLVKKIRVALNKSGKAVTRTTWGLGDTAEDPLAKELEATAATTAGRMADFTLSGKFIETTVHAGRTRQSTFSFQLSLSDARGLAVWEDEKEITKQGTRPSIGF